MINEYQKTKTGVNVGRDRLTELMISWNYNFMENIKKVRERDLLKRFVVILRIILPVVLLAGCVNENSPAIENENISVINIESQTNALENKISTDYFEGIEGTIIPFEKDFYDIIAANPIDQILIWEDSGSEDRIRFACEYRDVWEAEIKSILSRLKDYLSEEDYILLISAYEGWQQYMDNATLVEQGLFYIGSNYERADNNITTGDNDTYPRVMEAVATRTKNYAIELMSLEYVLTGNVEFLYSE